MKAVPGFFRFMLACQIALGTLWAPAGLSTVFAANDSINPIVTLLEDGLELTWTAAYPEFVPLEGGKYSLQMEGFHAEAGGLPFMSVLAAVPPGSQPQLDLIQVEEHQELLPGELELNPGDLPVVENLMPPDFPVGITEVGVQRGIHLLRITFSPLQQMDTSLRVITSVKAVVRFNAPSISGSEIRLPLDEIQTRIQQTVVNPAQVQAEPRWTVGEALSAASSGKYVVEVSQPGMVVLSYASLLQAGFPVERANPHTLHMSYASAEIPYDWQGDGDTVFEDGERLVFYAAPHDSRWNNRNSYFLWSSDAAGIWMGQREAVPAGLTGGSALVESMFEKNTLYTPDCLCGSLPLGRDGDRWVWERLLRPGDTQASYSFDLPNLNATKTAVLNLWMIGFTDTSASPDHKVAVQVNGSSLGSFTWDGKQALGKTLTIPAGILKKNGNTLLLSLPGITGVNVDGVWLDAFSVRYTRDSSVLGTASRVYSSSAMQVLQFNAANPAGIFTYDVTNPDVPEKLVGGASSGAVQVGAADSIAEHAYLLVSDAGLIPPVRIRPEYPLFTAGMAGANYLVIAPEEFIPSVADLVALRQSQGLQTAVERVEAIADNYGTGQVEPAVIYKFLQDVYQRWNPRPSFVLLVGDGTSDPKQYLVTSPKTFIPPYLEDIDPFAGEAAADNRYVTVEGNDILPDMMVGRLPVNSAEETLSLVQKLVRYEQGSVPSMWNSGIILAADKAGSAGNFPASAEALRATIQAPFISDPLYLGAGLSVSQVQARLFSHWNYGAGLVVFFGHSSIHQWATDNLLHISQVGNLKNGVRLPVLLEMTCFTSAFQTPGYDTLDETLLRSTVGGVAAVWGPTSLGNTFAHEPMAAGFMEYAFQHTQPLVGEAVMSGKLRLAAEMPSSMYLLDTHTLLGDPAMKINLQIKEKATYYLPLLFSLAQ